MFRKKDSSPTVDMRNFYNRAYTGIVLAGSNKSQFNLVFDTGLLFCHNNNNNNTTTTQHNTTQKHNKNTTQHNTTQHKNTTQQQQHNTTQHNTTQQQQHNTPFLFLHFYLYRKCRFMGIFNHFLFAFFY